MSKLQLILVLLVLFLVAPAIASAQDTQPSANLVPVIPIEDAGALLINTLLAIAGGAVLGAPITVFLTSVLKRIPQLASVSAGALAATSGIVITVIVWIARHFGFEVQINTLFDVIVVVAPALMTLFTTLTGGSALYSTAVKANAPIVSYQRASEIKASSPPRNPPHYST